MFYRVLDVNDMFNHKDNDHEIIEIMSYNNAQLKLVFVKKDSGFDFHMFNTNVCIYLTEGEIELSFPKKITCGCNICGVSKPEHHDNKNNEYKIKKGQMFLFEKDVRHSLKALKDSKFILVKI